jgi:hypothetical protein
VCCIHAGRLAAHYDVEGVVDSAVLVLAKFSGPLSPSLPKPRVTFGRDAKACAAVETLFLIATRWVFQHMTSCQLGLLWVM